MISFAHPLVARLVDHQGMITHTAAVSARDLTPVVNGATVAYYKQRCGGVSCRVRPDAVVQAVKQCDCEPGITDDKGSGCRFGCAVDELVIRLQSDGTTVFEQAVPVDRLAPIAHALWRRAEPGAERGPVCHWQLAADFAAEPPIAATRAASPTLVIEGTEPVVRPLRRPVPDGSMAQRPPDGGVPVYLRGETMDGLIERAKQSPDDLEVGGALLGQVGVDDDVGVFVVVEETPTLTTDGGPGAVIFRWQAAQEIGQLLQGNGEQALLGTWHTHHPSYREAFASAQDAWAFQSFFPDPWSIFAVVGRSRDLTAFFGWDSNGLVAPLALWVIGKSASRV